MRVVIDGGTGHIGWNMCYYSPVIDVAAVNSEDYAMPWDECKWDAVVHLAHVDPGRAIACAKLNHCPLLLASSGAVYHEQPNQYGLEKIAWEKQVLDSGVDCRIARIFTTCGSHMKWDNFAIGNFIQDAAWVGEITIKGSGQVVRSYIHGEDLAKWLWTILLEGESGNVYDVGSFQPVTILDVAQEVMRNFDPPRRLHILNYIPHEQAPVYLPRSRPGLGLRITIPFEEAVKRTVHSFMEEHAR